MALFNLVLSTHTPHTPPLLHTHTHTHPHPHIPTSTLQVITYTPSTPLGGHLYLKLDIILVKKIHVIRVVFQDQAMYARTSFRGAKTSKFWKKGVFFGYGHKFWKKRRRQIKKKTCKIAYLGSIFIRGKYVLRVCFESPFTRMISSLKYKCPPPGFTHPYTIL